MEQGELHYAKFATELQNYPYPNQLVSDFSPFKQKPHMNIVLLN
jgi:hypothetical protein